MTDRHLIEHYLPIEAISAEARREKSVRKGHISTLHLWWARRPLVAARAAVFGALAPQDASTPPNSPPNLPALPTSRRNAGVSSRAPTNGGGISTFWPRRRSNHRVNASRNLLRRSQYPRNVNQHPNKSGSLAVAGARCRRSPC